MIANAESTAEGATAHEAEVKNPLKNLADLAQTAIEKYVGMEKAVLDLLVKQNTTAIDAVRAAAPTPNAGPLFASLDLYKNGIGTVAEASKNMLDLAARQSAAWTAAVADCADQMGCGYRNSFSDSFKDAAERATAMQKLVFDFAARQTDLASEIMKPLAEPSKGKSVAETAADSVRRSVDLLVETQKQFLEVASRPPKVKKAGAGS